ncbi:hypothetical protein [Neobacillus sp. OS1-33]|uniref:hypothetical protein n=1 Tax=Neobacillus sp. OS1-33 TaxID=3070683 RepID=UPI0035A61798
MGKTDVMLHFAKMSGGAGFLPIVFSLEMPEKLITSRLIASTGGFNRSKMPVSQITGEFQHFTGEFSDFTGEFHKFMSEFFYFMGEPLNGFRLENPPLYKL